MSEKLTASSGFIKDGAHFLPLRVYYEDTDAGGIVYHSQYLNFMERGRTEMLRMCGFEHFAMMTTQTSPTLLVVKNMDIDFIAPAVIDDQLLVETKMIKMGAASMRMSQRVLKDDEILVTAELKAGVLGADKRPKKMPPGMREKISEMLGM